jgi:hypothetical protein
MVWRLRKKKEKRDIDLKPETIHPPVRFYKANTQEVDERGKILFGDNERALDLYRKMNGYLTSEELIELEEIYDLRLNQLECIRQEGKLFEKDSELVTIEEKIKTLKDLFSDFESPF